MVTKYIAGDGTGDYNCDGTDDDVEINAAFAWAASNPGTVIYFKGPFKYNIGNKILVGSDVTVTGDSTACVRLENSAGWATGIPMFGNRSTNIANVEFYGFEIDGNDVNQAEGRGDGYYMMIYFTNVTNSSVHDMYLHDSLADGFRTRVGSNARFYNNTCKRLGHDGSYFELTTGGEVYNNYTEIRTNSAHRVRDSSNISIHDNTMKPYALTSISGGPGIEIEDSTGNTTNIEVYNNTLTDCWAEGIWVIEYGAGNTNQNKNLYIHNNTIKSTGRITTINYHAGITMQGFNGARIEDNIIDGCYNAGVMCKYAPLTPSTIFLTNNVIKNTKRTLATAYQTPDAAWTGTGVVNHHPSTYVMILNGNSVTDSAGAANYYQVDYANDKLDTSDPHYIPPAPYAPPDTGYNYYVDGRTAYINGYPFNWTDKKIDVGKTMGQLKSPGTDGWSLEDFGFGGADITLDCYADSFVDMRQAIAAFYQEGRSVLELGGIYAGYRITGYTTDHSTNLRLSDQTYEYNYPYSVGFTADQPIMEKVQPRVRGRRVSSSGEQWASDNIFTGNLVSNFDFESWTNVKVGMSWQTRATASSDENEWRYVCWSPELQLYCAVAQTGTDNRVMTSPDGIVWTRQTLSNANRNQQWRCVTWASDLLLFVAVSISGTGYRVMTSPDGVNWSQRSTTGFDNSWLSVCYTGDFSASADVAVGTNPGAVAITPDGTKTYVCNFTAGTVSVITNSTHAIAATITVGANPNSIVITPDGTKAYVSNAGAGTVSVITVASNTVAATITIGDSTTGVGGLSATPDSSKVYCCNAGDTWDGTTVSVIATASNTVTSTITVGNAPNSSVVTPNGSKLYVANYMDNSISVITVATGVVATTITNVGEYPYDLAVSPDGAKVYATGLGVSNDGTTVSVVSTSSDTVTNSIGGFISPLEIAVTPDGSKAYVTSNSGVISVINLRDEVVSTSLNAGIGASGIAIGNNSIYIANYDDNDVTVYRLGRFIATAVSGTANRVMTSYDGITWTTRSTTSKDFLWTSVTFSPELRRAVAVAYGSAGDTPVMTSDDGGITWTLRTLSNANRTQQWDSVCWSATLTLFVAVSENGTTSQVMTSPDGITWTAQTTPFASGRGFRSVVWAHELGVFVAVANTGTQDRAMYSANGTTWVSMPTPVTDNNWFCVCYSPYLGMFAAVAASGTATRAMTSVDYGTLQTHDVAPDNWTLVTQGQEMYEAEDVFSGTKCYKITGNGVDDNIGYISQQAFIEPTVYYVLAARGKVVGLTQGQLEISVFSGNMVVASIQFTADTDWNLKTVYFHFDTIPSDAVVRILGTGTVNNGAELYADYVTLQTVPENGSFTLGNDILTDGTVNCVPEVTVSAASLVGGVSPGTTITSVEPNVFSNISNNYLLDATYTISGKLWKKMRLDSISTKMKGGTGASCWVKVTVQATSLYAGVETTIKEWSTTSTAYITNSYSPNLLCGTNETLTIRLYVKTSVLNTRVYVDDFTYTYTEVGASASVTNVKIYNRADPLNVLWAANNLFPGASMAIRSDQTGFFKYKEDFDDNTYASCIYETSGTVTYNSTTKQLTLGSNAYITYGFDTRYPVTGIPFLNAFINSGSPYIYIAEDNNGVPGTFYSVDNNSDTDVTNAWGAWNLDSQLNLRLKGNTIWYVRIKSPSGQTAIISKLLIYADLLTVDAEQLKVLATGAANTFVVEMDNPAALDVTLSYRDAHMVI